MRSSLFRHVSTFAIAAVAAGSIGCGGKVEPNTKVDVMGGATASDQEKIRKHLDDAGVKGAIVSSQDGGDEWLVDVGAAPVAPGKRQMNIMPETVRVNKATGKVSKLGAQ